MRRLSSPITHLKPSYTVVVVGSGYGGAITASRLARAGQQVCVLERGREWKTGDFPRTADAMSEELQLRYTGEKTGVDVGAPTNLFEFTLGPDSTVIAGCGLGGTSLINASVSLKPDPRVFQDARWPRAVREDEDGLLQESFGHAERMLRPTPYPEHFPKLTKNETLAQSAQKLPGRFYHVPINVNFEPGLNPAGVEQPACTLCGDCATGCNYGAKNTLMMNYLPDAHAHGAEIFTEVAVRSVARDGQRWRVYVRLLGVGRENFDAPELFITADNVILAAGTLGSTEILLRSRARGLEVSRQLGQRFSGNGDVLAFGYNLDTPVHAVGHGPHEPEEMRPVGPTITSVIDQRDTPRLEDGRIIEEGIIPGALGPLLPAAFVTASTLIGDDTDEGFKDALLEVARALDSTVRGPYHGAVDHTQSYLVMAHDDGAGRMELRDDRIHISWQGAGQQETFVRTNEMLRRAVEAHGGTYVRNPLWSELSDYDVLITHPLGGCIMGEDAEHGVVDPECRVFSGESGTQVHEGLYVCDGAVIPRPLGVNPLLAISAVAERTAALMARRNGWDLDYAPAPAPLPSSPKPKVGVVFTETMHGFYSDAVDEDYAKAGNPEAPGAHPFRFILTILIEDLDTFLEGAGHEARMVGSVLAPDLSPSPLSVLDGRFQLFVKDPERPGQLLMRYAMKLVTETGERYAFEGFKEIHDDAGFDLWSDTTTLYVTLSKGDGPEAPAVGKGFLRITLEDFTRQLTTMRVLHAEGGLQQAEAMGRFARFFMGTLYDTYGKLLVG